VMNPLQSAVNVKTRGRNAFTARNLRPPKDLLSRTLFLSLFPSKVCLFATQYRPHSKMRLRIHLVRRCPQHLSLCRRNSPKLASSCT
jgi:hypothetical protein